MNSRAILALHASKSYLVNASNLINGAKEAIVEFRGLEPFAGDLTVAENNVRAASTTLQEIQDSLNVSDNKEVSPAQSSSQNVPVKTESDIIEILQALENLREERESLTVDLDKAEQERDEHATRLTQRLQELQELQQKFSELQTTLKRAFSEGDRAVHALAEEQTAHQQLDSRLRENDVRHEQLSSQHAAELQALQQKTEEQEKSLAVLNEELAFAKSVNMERQEALDTMERQIKEQIAAGDGRASALSQAALDHTEREFKRMMKDKIQRDEECVELRSKLAMVTKELEWAHQAKAIVEREKLALQEKLTLKLEKLEQNLEAATSKRKEMQAANTEINLELQNAIAATDSAKSETNKVRQQLSETIRTVSENNKKLKHELATAAQNVAKPLPLWARIQKKPSLDFATFLQAPTKSTHYRDPVTKLLPPFCAGNNCEIPEGAQELANPDYIWTLRSQHILWAENGFGHFVLLVPCGYELEKMLMPKPEERKELFYQFNSLWYYMGTYECVFSAIVDHQAVSTTPFLSRNKVSKKPTTTTRTTDYKCFFMECIGFNAALHSLLPQHQSKKRASQPSATGMSLQKRIKSSDQALSDVGLAVYDPTKPHGTDWLSLQKRIEPDYDMQDVQAAPYVNVHSSNWEQEQTYLGNHGLGHAPY